MSDEVFSPQKRRLSSSDMSQNSNEQNMESLASIQAVQRAAAGPESGGNSPMFSGENPLKFSGKMPAGMLAALQNSRSKESDGDDDYDDNNQEQPFIPTPVRNTNRKSDGSDQPRRNNASQNQFADPKPNPISDQFEAILNRIKGTTHHYSLVDLPSKGKFYDGTDGPENGVLHVRPMTGEEEQILATPRFMKGGKAIDMIFRNCIQERINPEKLLTADRTAVLIFLRGISYGRKYEVEIKCPQCANKFSTTIDLDESIDVEECPEDFGVGNMTDVLPVSGLRFSYRLSRGKDETAVQQYREKRLKSFTDATDDTLAYRAALLITEIEGIRDHHQLQALHKQLPIGDVSFIRNLLNEPPFGVNTEVPMSCTFCYEEFNTELPLDANFFFPKPMKREPASN